MPTTQTQVRADRCLGGWIQLDVHVMGSIRATIALTEENAIQLTDQLRRALEDPTMREPEGKNIQVMKIG